MTPADVLSSLGFTPEAIAALQRLPTLGLAEERLEMMKTAAKALFRKYAFEWHPDRNPGDPSAAERIRLLIAVHERIQGFRVQPSQPVQVLAVSFHYYPPTNPYSGTAVATYFRPTVQTVARHPEAVVQMKPKVD